MGLKVDFSVVEAACRFGTNLLQHSVIFLVIFCWLMAYHFLALSYLLLTVTH